jgi:uncharacterized damage-inducible protein DinB
MDPLTHHLASMAFNNAWANHRLLRAVGQLSQGEFIARRTGFFPSFKGTLNHIVTVDWFYLDALERGLSGQPVNRENHLFFAPEEPFDDCAPLHEAQRVADRRLVALCTSLRGEQLATPIGILRSSGVVFETTTRLLAHLFQHQIHHRGQAHAMLSGTSVAPPQLDEFFCASEAPLRAAELAELGYSEAMIWGG